eukprot:1328476-Amorphochlora_amoeboformis.AAC.1
MLEPYVHYVPISSHMGNLEQVLAWVKGHPKETEQIGKNAKKFYDAYLTFQASAHYVHSLLSKLSKIQREIDIGSYVRQHHFNKSKSRPCSAHDHDHGHVHEHELGQITQAATQTQFSRESKNPHSFSSTTTRRFGTALWDLSDMPPGPLRTKIVSQLVNTLPDLY